uniref:PREDICTED: copia proteinlike putative n=1 Tax=Albugo laibachii Nc14 TaxID=890382 RepID=F0WJN0_9STRA|nr:PREDICTED: copia proteinlike putative [Albugo laibachii Nc14]|eukprot:CCA21479.1 PREDICTED: copia proteinlike putative [Albugo laibachii Nc14]
MQMVLEEPDLWEVVSGDMKLENCVIIWTGEAPVAMGETRDSAGGIQNKVSQGDGYHLPWNERFAIAFSSKSLAKKLFLRRLYFTIKMEDGDDVLEHISNVKTVAEQLDAIGAPVREDDLVITLLGSLSDSFQFLITACLGMTFRLADVGTFGVSSFGREEAQRTTKKEDWSMILLW